MDCPKCGSTAGWTGPVYHWFASGSWRNADIRFNERLQYTCSTCGYVREEPTKDARQEPTVPAFSIACSLGHPLSWARIRRWLSR